MAEKIYSKEIISDPDLMPEVEEFLINIAKENNLEEEKYNSLALSASEAVSNSIVHGNKLDETKKVFINVIVKDDEMRIIFKDEGTGFNPENVPDPTNPENILKDSGRGIHIMKSFIDELKYNFTPSGTETILIIRLH
ncbi:ATP-binding protein [Bacteroidota bacterium]